MTLREVSADARVSLGYISEIERGQKEASSELLASLCAALDVPLSDVLREVSDAVAEQEAVAARVARARGHPDPGAGARPALRRRRLRRLTASDRAVSGPAGRTGTSTTPARAPARRSIVDPTGVPQRRHGCRSRR